MRSRVFDNKDGSFFSFLFAPYSAVLISLAPPPHLCNARPPARGDFMVSPRGCGDAIFYVVVTDFPGHPSEGIEEWVVKVPMKTGLMASCKTNNYLLNALTAMESQVRTPPPHDRTLPIIPASC